MEDSRLLVAAMAAQCREAIRGSNEQETSLPKALHPKHLLWMSDQIEKHAQESSVSRLHRWLGFVQARILANRMLDLDQIKAMFNQLKKLQPISGEEQDLIDHLDVDSSFSMDLGGQG